MGKDDTINILAEPVRELVCPECSNVINVVGKDILSDISCSECGMDLTVPARIGEFIIAEILGSGGMATVYKAYDESLGRYVAIKIMQKTFGRDPKFVERFLREARAAARLNHPNVVQIYSCGEKSGQPYIVMEYVDGDKLDEVIAREAPLPTKRVLDIGRDVANGLRAAADIGLVHGDIKPANILFDRNGSAKVADFGLAHFAQEQTEDEIWGTPYYIAPERARKEKQDQRSDIYCLGATLFHALTGNPPFDGETAVDVVMARLKNEAPDIREFVPRACPATAKIIARMLEMEIFRRHPNYNSLLSDLERTIKEADGFKETVKKNASKGGGKKVIFISLGLLILVGVFFAIFATKKESQNPESSSSSPVAKTTVKPKSTTVFPIQPFAPGQDKILSTILNGLSPETTVSIENDLQKLMKSLPSDHPSHDWCQLFYAMTPLMKCDKKTAVRRFKMVSAKKREIDMPAHYIPGVFAGFMEKKKATLKPDSGAEWPLWSTHLSLFFQGMKELSYGDPKNAIAFMNKYAAITSSGSPDWPYSLQKSARDLSKQAQNWEKLVSQTDALIAQEKYDAAIESLNANHSAIFATRKSDKIRLINQKKQKKMRKRQDEETRKRREELRLATEKRKALELEQAMLIEKDANLLINWDVNSIKWLFKNQFSEAYNSLMKLKVRMGSDYGKTSCEKRIVEVHQLKMLKDFLILSINTTPYDKALNILKGTAIEATQENITVTPTNIDGTIVFNWSRATPTLIVPMAQFYIKNSRASVKTKNEVMMGLISYSRLRDLGIEEELYQQAERLTRHP